MIRIRLIERNSIQLLLWAFHCGNTKLQNAQCRAVLSTATAQTKQHLTLSRTKLPSLVVTYTCSHVLSSLCQGGSDAGIMGIGADHIIIYHCMFFVSFLALFIKLILFWSTFIKGKIWSRSNLWAEVLISCLIGHFSRKNLSTNHARAAWRRRERDSYAVKLLRLLWVTWIR